MSEALKLTGTQRRILREGIIGAYPKPDELRILLAEQMEVQLGVIVGDGAYSTKVFDLIEAFDTDGRIKEFIRLIVKEKPNSPYLKEVKNQFQSILEEQPIIDPPPMSPILRSARGINYQKLDWLLNKQQWREADAVTCKVILEVANRSSEGWLNPEDINNFPCEDLQTIDRLWVEYSKGHFGFSVQAQIYRDIGGKRDYYRVC